MGPTTETRTRDEWLDEVKRRGGRLRRRRRVTMAVVGGLALMVPLGALSTLLGGGAERSVELSVAGPAPAGARAGEAATGAPDADPMAAPADEPVVTTTIFSAPPFMDLPLRSAPETPAAGPVVGEVPRPTVPADDPVVRSTTTVAPAQVATTPATLPQNRPAGAVASSTAASRGLGPCAAADLQIDVVPSQATFAVGETVRGTFFVQTARAADCTVAMPASFRIEDVATGAVVGSAVATSEHPAQVIADGRMYTSTFAWDQRDCSGPACAPVPPALYQAVAEWAGGSPYRGWGEFRISG